jgi:hypothetical protein
MPQLASRVGLRLTYQISFVLTLIFTKGYNVHAFTANRFCTSLLLYVPKLHEAFRRRILTFLFPPALLSVFCTLCDA